MKKATTILLFLCFLCFGGALYAQKIDMPADRMEELLSRKWTAAYSIMGDLRIDPRPGAAQINYEFKKDKTFLLTGNPKEQAAQGAWKYDKEKSTIRLTVNGINNTRIISLTDEKLVMLVDMKNATPDDPTPIKMVYKIIVK